MCTVSAVNAQHSALFAMPRVAGDAQPAHAAASIDLADNAFAQTRRSIVCSSTTPTNSCPSVPLIRRIRVRSQDPCYRSRKARRGQASRMYPKAAAHRQLLQSHLSLLKRFYSFIFTVVDIAS